MSKNNQGGIPLSNVIALCAIIFVILISIMASNDGMSSLGFVGALVVAGLGGLAISLVFDTFR